jgi:hypothetical protein
MGNNRSVFSYPSADTRSAWDTKLNLTLGATDDKGVFDFYGISENSLFSYGYISTKRWRTTPRFPTRRAGTLPP